ncbi:hypothetical protein [Flavobacterium sp.]|uniref:hypothetical protein n=1 Tax=Flavobacterium sp. TaxID=239 RepID=UPI002FDE067D
MKNLLQLFAFVLVSSILFSCTTDEYDAALEESVKVTENIQNIQSKEGDGETPPPTVEETQPVIVIKKD